VEVGVLATKDLIDYLLQKLDDWTKITKKQQQKKKSTLKSKIRRKRSESIVGVP